MKVTTTAILSVILLVKDKFLKYNSVLKIYLSVILVSLSVNFCFAQQTPDEIIKAFFEDEKFDSIIEFKNEHGDIGLNDESFYYIGISYFDSDNFDRAIEYLSKVSANDPEHRASRYYAGLSYFNIADYDNAFRLMDECTEISGKVFYIEEKAEMLIELKRDDEAFQLLDEIYASGKMLNSRGYILLSDLLGKKGETGSVIDILETAKRNADKDDDDLFIILYKLGFEYNKQKNYKASNENLLELLRLIPNVKIIYPIIIQNYNSQNDFVSGMKYRGELYTDFEAGNLDENLGNRFMFDEFDWQGKTVRGFERFDPPDEEREYPFYKHTFYILNIDGDVDFTIQTELFFGRDMVGIDYVLGRSEYIDDEYYHETYGTLNFNEPVLDYEKLRNSVLKILNKEVNPTTSSRRKVNR